MKVRILKAEVVETLLYGCVMWTLSAKHFVKGPNGAPPSPPASHMASSTDMGGRLHEVAYFGGVPNGTLLSDSSQECRVVVPTASGTERASAARVD